MSALGTSGVTGGSGTLVESGGTTLSIGSIVANALLARVGATIAGVVPAAAGDIPIWTGSAWAMSQRATAQGATVTKDVILENTTPATSGVTTQYSPGLALVSHGWSSGAGADAKQTFCVYNRPFTGTTASAGLYIAYAAGAAALSTLGYITSAGALNWTGGSITCSARVQGTGLQATADPGGNASMTTLTNGTGTPASGSATLNNLPTGYSTTASYIKIYVGTVAHMVPTFAAA